MKKSLILGVAYLLFVTLFIFIAFRRWAYDDPFITYRYAYNLSHGLGFVYNPGERVLSTTTPLFTLLLAGFAPLWSNLPQLANLVGAFSLALGGLFIWMLARSWEAPWIGWSGLLLYPTFPLIISTLGSETPLYLALCLGAFAFYAAKRYRLTAVFAALAILTRPDGALVPALIGLDYLLRHTGAFIPTRIRRIGQTIFHRRVDNVINSPSDNGFPWQAILIFVCLTAAWFIFAWVYFGSPWPATLATKQHQGAMAISQRFAPGFWTVIQGYISNWFYWLEAGLALCGIIFIAWRARRWLLLLLWTGLYFLAYTILGVSRYYWYYAPLVPGFIVLIGAGIWAVSRLGSTSRHPASSDPQSQPSPGERHSIFLAGALLIVFAVLQIGDLWRLQDKLDQRAAIYHAVGIWLQKNTPPVARIGSLEVGIIGYYARRPMIDFAGLIQPDVAAQLTADTTYDDAALWAIDHYRPDYLVLNKGQFPALQAGYLAQNCEVIKRFPGQGYGYPGSLLIYSCPYVK
jgi:hypothetical protein